MKFFATNGHKHFNTNTILMAIYLIEISTIGYVIETLGNVIKMLKYLPQSQSTSVTI